MICKCFLRAHRSVISASSTVPGAVADNNGHHLFTSDFPQAPSAELLFFPHVAEFLNLETYCHTYPQKPAVLRLYINFSEMKFPMN